MLLTLTYSYFPADYKLLLIAINQFIILIEKCGASPSCLFSNLPANSDLLFLYILCNIQDTHTRTYTHTQKDRFIFIMYYMPIDHFKSLLFLLIFYAIIAATFFAIAAVCSSVVPQKNKMIFYPPPFQFLSLFI